MNSALAPVAPGTASAIKHNSTDNQCKALKNTQKDTKTELVGPPERAYLSSDILVSLELRVSLKSLK